MNPSDYDKNPGAAITNYRVLIVPKSCIYDTENTKAWQTSAGQATNDNAASAWDWERIIAAFVCMGVCVIVWAMLFKPLVYGLADALAWVRGLV